MNIIKPSFEILEQESGLEGIFKQIELAGRNCYKSEDKITEDSSKSFVERMIKLKHFAMLEHGTVYLKIPYSDDAQIKYRNHPYSKVVIKTYEEPTFKQDHYITTNYRVLVENNWLDDLKYLCEPTKYHHPRVCVRFTSSIHFYKDVTRHRVFSYAIESTRFCNYIKEKFGSSISFVFPIWLKEEEQEEFNKDLSLLESIYFKWINKGWQAQHAAYFLPQGTKADTIMTGFVKDFKHLFNLRSTISQTGKPHPSVLELIEPLRQEFIKKRLVTYE